MKLCFIDCETTGTNPDKNGLVQIAGILTADGKILDQFDLKMCTFPDDAVDAEALKVNGLDRATIDGWQAPFDGYSAFVKRLGSHCDKFNRADKYHFIGYNADFDASFVRKFFEKCGDKYFGSWFWWPIIDVSKVAGIRLMRDRHLLPDFKLATVAGHMQIPFDAEQLHDAMTDVQITIKLFKLFMADIPSLNYMAAKP